MAIFRVSAETVLRQIVEVEADSQVKAIEACAVSLLSAAHNIEMEIVSVERLGDALERGKTVLLS